MTICAFTCARITAGPFPIWAAKTARNEAKSNLSQVAPALGKTLALDMLYFCFNQVSHTLINEHDDFFLGLPCLVEYRRVTSCHIPMALTTGPPWNILMQSYRSLSPWTA